MSVIFLGPGKKLWIYIMAQRVRVNIRKIFPNMKATEADSYERGEEATSLEICRKSVSC